MSSRRYTPKYDVQEIPPGTHVGNYKIKRLIDTGGMGAVYYAVHTIIGKKVAIKFLHPPVARNKENVQRFLQEARIVNAISDPGIVDIFDYGTYNGRHYVVMEYMKGERLLEFIDRNGKLSPFPAAQLLRMIAISMSKVHKQGVVHRDLKAENIFLLPSSDGNWPPRIKILDFGLAKLLEPIPGHQPPQTHKGITLGTPYYMSPEQCKGEPIDHRADIYSFGVLAFEMLTGRLPFWSNDPIEVMEMHISAVPKLYPYKDRPKRLDQLILGCLEKNPEDRPQSMEEIVLTLEIIYPALKPFETWEKIARSGWAAKQSATQNSDSSHIAPCYITPRYLPKADEPDTLDGNTDYISTPQDLKQDHRSDDSINRIHSVGSFIVRHKKEALAVAAAGLFAGLSLGMLVGHFFF